jgi:tRNA1Val (adenine37-N6)-methyltransferase
MVTGCWILDSGFWLFLRLMANSYFQFKQFTIHQDHCAMKVTTDACLFGAWIVNEVKNQKLKVKPVLDIGTGTGLLSLMVAQKNPELKIDAIEIDTDAAEQAKINVGSSPWKEQINIIQADMKEFSFEKEFDLIISNPPFYEKEIRSATHSKNVAHHSENLTLKELLVIIKDNLSKTGSFFLLLPYKRNEEIKKLLNVHELKISKILFVRQSVKHDYFRIFIKGSLNTEDKETEFDELSILNEKQQYTHEFVTLLKDYYLHL